MHSKITVGTNIMKKAIKILVALAGLHAAVQVSKATEEPYAEWFNKETTGKPQAYGVCYTTSTVTTKQAAIIFKGYAQNRAAQAAELKGIDATKEEGVLGPVREN
jgi:hypothetical protein